MTLEILTLGLMKEYFQDTHPPKGHKTKERESADVKVDDIKPRKEKNLDSIENACDDKIKYLKKDQSIHNKEEDKEREDTQEDDE